MNNMEKVLGPQNHVSSSMEEFILATRESAREALRKEIMAPGVERAIIKARIWAKTCVDALTGMPTGISRDTNLREKCEGKVAADRRGIALLAITAVQKDNSFGAAYEAFRYVYGQFAHSNVEGFRKLAKSMRPATNSLTTFRKEWLKDIKKGFSKILLDEPELILLFPQGNYGF